MKYWFIIFFFIPTSRAYFSNSHLQFRMDLFSILPMFKKVLDLKSNCLCIQHDLCFHILLSTLVPAVLTMVCLLDARNIPYPYILYVAKPVSASQRTNCLTPHFIGLAGIYCLKNILPLNLIMDSSLLKYFPGIKYCVLMLVLYYKPRII
jgi:hypothetical protein